MQDIHRYLDHAVLKPELTRDEAQAALQMGIGYEVIAVCVRPADIELAVAMCRGTNTAVGTVLSFPHGVGHPQVKTLEARTYIDLGVREIDMVANYGLIRSGLWAAVAADIGAVADVTRPAGILLKVILETSELELAQIGRATEITAGAGADYVKTSTGFASAGASEEAVGAMLAAAAGRIAVKASGGIRDRACAERFIAMGCSRLGVGYTSTPVICEGTVAGGAARTAPRCGGSAPAR